MFPSPTGVTYDECDKSEYIKGNMIYLFPSPTGVTYDELANEGYNTVQIMFPSPTGVTYDEYYIQ